MGIFHKFDGEFIDQDLRGKLKGRYKNYLFFNCIFGDISNVELIDCVLNRCKFTTDSLEKCRHVAITMECATFHGVELSEFLFDLIIVLLTKSTGNDSKRRKLISVIGKDKAKQILKSIKDLD